MPSFPYRKLNRSVNEIRLVQIHSGYNPTADVHCDLLYVPQDDELRYSALSYTWGSDSRTREISLNGRRFGVTESLYAALCALRNDFSQLVGAYVWIDAICINQDDIDERNVEVQRMFSIFQSAFSVYVWLGPRSDDSDLAMDHLEALSASASAAHSRRTRERLTRIFNYVGTLFILYIFFTSIAPANIVMRMVLYLFRHRDVEYYFITRWIVRTHWVINTIMGSVSAGIYWWKKIWMPGRFDDLRVSPPPHPKLVSALKALFSRAWFSRTWILQECGAAKDIFVLCGARSLHWDIVINAVDEMHDIASSATSRHAFLDIPYIYLSSLNQLRENWKLPPELAHQRQSLLHILNEFSSYNATDPKDKVYGLLGLSAEYQSRSRTSKLVPDYRKTDVKVFIDTARYLIKSSDNLDVLRACLFEGSVGNLPSWVPDWTVKRERSVGWPEYWQTPFHVERGGFPRRPTATFPSDMRRVIVHGIVVARLHKCQYKGRLASEGVIGYTINDMIEHDRRRSKKGVEGAFALPLSMSSFTSSEPLEYARSILMMILTIIQRIILLPGMPALCSYLARLNPLGFGIYFKSISLGLAEQKARRRGRNNKAMFQNVEVLEQNPRLDHSPRQLSTFWKIRLLGRKFAFGSHASLFQDISTRAPDVEVDDLVVLFLGAKVPFIIREVSRKVDDDDDDEDKSGAWTWNTRNSKEYRLLGPAHVGPWLGYLHTKVRDAFHWGEFAVEDFTLI